MSPKNLHLATTFVLLALSGSIIYGCDATPAASSRNSMPGVTYRPPPTPEGASEPVSLLIDARPAVLANGRSITWSRLRPVLNELAGGQALQEIILDSLLEDRVTGANLKIGSNEITRERLLLLKNLSDDPNLALRLLNELRDRRHLGPRRFEALLLRNARLRALVQFQILINEGALRRTHQLLYGEKRQARLITRPSLSEAESVYRRAQSGENFSDLAVEVSSDSSASRGGLLEPITRDDPLYPSALRDAIWKLIPDTPSPPILIDDQFALLKLVKTIEPEDIDFEQVRPELVRLTRLNQERLRMEQLARSLLSNVSIVFFDDTLRDSYRAVIGREEDPLRQ